MKYIPVYLSLLWMLFQSGCTHQIILPNDTSVPLPLQCLTASDTSVSKVPNRLPVGVETIHRDPKKIITIELPMAPEGIPSRIMDVNGKPAIERMPDRWVMSDGTVRTAFIGVDRSTGSRLDLCITELAARLPRMDNEATLEFLRDHLQDYLREPSAGFVFSWDKDSNETAELKELYLAAKDLPVGQYPLRSKQSHAVVLLEEFLRAGYGTCLHKAILASLLLEKLNIPHRLVNGATQKSGHTWVQLQDGRILDPSLKLLERPTLSQALPGYFKYGDTFAFENQVWPYLAL